MKIKILDSAQKDLINGYRFYEEQKLGLGSYFLDSLFSDIDSLRKYAGIHAVCFKKYRRLLSKRFPFAIYYNIENKNVLVCAVLDNRIDPIRIKNSLS
jgi:plasmid stabilization system protein ParE